MTIMAISVIAEDRSSNQQDQDTHHTMLPAQGAAARRARTGCARQRPLHCPWCPHPRWRGTAGAAPAPHAYYYQGPINRTLHILIPI